MIEYSNISLPNQREIITDIGIDIVRTASFSRSPQPSYWLLLFYPGSQDFLHLYKGGSLAKIIYFSKNPHGSGCQINFTKFETKQIDKCIEFIRGLWDRSELTARVIKGKTR